MYPNLIVDNFFEDPDSIVDLSENIEYTPSSDGRWPGFRSNYLHRIYPRLFDFIYRLKKEDLKLFTMFFRKLEAHCSNLINILRIY